MSSSARAVTPFDVGLRLMELLIRNISGKLDKQQTHLKRRLTEDIADVKRRIKLGGLDDISFLSDPK